jgi:uncharacterized protein (DUF4415 family)
MRRKIETSKRAKRRNRASTKSWPLITLWLDPDVEAYFRRGGRGWQSRINAALRKAAKLPKEKRKKA